MADWLMITSWAKHSVDEQLEREGDTLTRQDYLRRVVEQNVRLQVKHLTHLTIVRNSRKNRGGLPRLHGWAYDIATGLIKVREEGIRGHADLAPASHVGVGAH